MEIKYTSINDVYAHYAFNFKNTTEGIEELNHYAVKEIAKSKKLSDSINLKLSQLSKEEAAKYLSENNLPTSADNLIIYSADSLLNNEPTEKNIIVKYILDEDNFKIKEIQFPNAQNLNSKRGFIVDQETKKITMDSKDLTIEELKGIIIVIKKQNTIETLNYNVRSIDNKEILQITLDNYGQYISLSFK